MALKKAVIQAVNGRPLMGTKAMRIPAMTEMKTRGYLIKTGRGSLKMTTPKMIPPANWKNCFRVMSPTKRNSYELMFWGTACCSIGQVLLYINPSFTIDGQISLDTV